jgi:carbonic anhydrase
MQRANFETNRRTFLSLSAGAVSTVALVNPLSAFAADGATTKVTADEALAKLKAGNDLFVKAPQACAANLISQRGQVALSQAPWATIVGCADSRVPPELLFGGLGLGELFVARNAGNMVDTATMGTIEYGAAVLGVPLIVVLGHERCGAVAAACDIVLKNASFPGSIGPMVDAIVPVAKTLHGQPGDFVDNVVRASAKATAVHVASTSAIVQGLIANGRVKIVAARYDLDSGGVEFLG